MIISWKSWKTDGLRHFCHCVKLQIISEGKIMKKNPPGFDWHIQTGCNVTGNDPRA